MAAINLLEIPEVPAQILQAASRGKLVVFVGAGVSRIIGCPSWEKFALKYLDYIYDKKCITFYEYENLKQYVPRKLLSICMNIIKEKRRLSGPDLRSIFEGEKEKINKFYIFEYLYNFNAIYVTTNYDEHLDLIAERNDKTTLKYKAETEVEEMKVPTLGNKVLYRKEDLLSSNLAIGKVLHLHGSIKDQRNMVVTIVDYIKNYEKDSIPAVLLEEIFSNYTVLFVGYGVEEYELLEFIVNKSATPERVVQHFMLYPVFSAERALNKFLKSYYRDLGIQLVHYSIGKQGYEQLANVIKEWARKIGPISRPQSFLERRKIIKEVI